MNKRVKYDDEYIRYIKSGKSAAVFIMRDIDNSINTANKWIDVIELRTYYLQEKEHFIILL